MLDIENKVIKVISQMINPKDRHQLNINSELLESKLIDSFGLVQLIAELEVVFEISILTEDLTIENFGKVENIICLVKRIISGNSPT